MQSIDLNLATRPFKNDTLPWVGFVVAVLLLGFTTWYNLDTWRRHRTMLDDLSDRQENIDSRLEQLDARSSSAERRIDKKDLPVIFARSNKANEVIRWKAFSWTRLFNMLQEVQPANVQLNSLHPVFRGERGPIKNEIEDLEQVPVSVEGIAKDLRAFLEFERALIASPHFDRIDPGTLSTDDVTSERIFRMRFLYDPRITEEEEAAAEEVPAEGAEPGEAGEDSADAPEGTVVAAETPAGTEDAPAIEPLLEGEEDSQLATGKLPKIKRGGKKNRNRPGQETGGQTPAPGGGEAEGSASPQTPQLTPEPQSGIDRDGQPAEPADVLPVRTPRPDWGAGVRPLNAGDDEDED